LTSSLGQIVVCRIHWQRLLGIGLQNSKALFASFEGKEREGREKGGENLPLVCE